LVSRVVSVDELEDVLADITKTIVGAPPLSMRLAKRCIDQGVELDPRGALATELLAIEENLATSDWRAGIARFGEKA
jgi:enoyl-CoA hydratase